MREAAWTFLNAFHEAADGASKAELAAGWVTDGNAFGYWKRLDHLITSCDLWEEIGYDKRAEWEEIRQQFASHSIGPALKRECRLNQADLSLEMILHKDGLDDSEVTELLRSKIREALEEAASRPARPSIPIQVRHDDTQSDRPRRIGRNDPCPCGSGKKFKKCCLPKMRYFE